MTNESSTIVIETKSNVKIDAEPSAMRYLIPMTTELKSTSSMDQVSLPEYFNPVTNWTWAITQTKSQSLTNI